MTKKENMGLELTLQGIEKQWGAGALFRGLDGENTVKDIEFISSGSIQLDVILGGGYGRGRVVDIFGPASCGKTTSALHAIAEAQRAGGVCAFIDAEHALDKQYAKALGVNTSTLLVSQPDFAEQALDIMDRLTMSGGLHLIVLDSVAALVPRAELEGDIGDAHVGLQARLMSQTLRKLSGIAYKTGTTLMFLNQMRSTIGGYGPGPSTASTGGNALKFYSSQRLDIRRIGAKKEGDIVVGNKTKIKTAKNKITAPFREIELVLTYGKGLNKTVEILDLATRFNLIKKGGAWYTIGEENIQGQSNASEYLEAHPEKMKELDQAIREKIAANGGKL